MSFSDSNAKVLCKGKGDIYLVAKDTLSQMLTWTTIVKYVSLHACYCLAVLQDV